MFSNDSISEQDRSRVFNLYIVPALNDKKILKNVTQEKSYILFSYRFSDDLFKYEQTLNLTELHDQFKQADETGSDHYHSFIKQLKIKPKNPHNKVYICVFQYAPCDSFHPSMYSFDQTIVDDWNDSIMMGEPPKTSNYNVWFSNKIIKSMIKWDQMKTITATFDQAPEGTVPVMIIKASNDNEMGFYHVDYEKYLKECNKALVPLDMQKLIADEYRKGHLLIIHVINYLRDYFLLVKTEQETFTFIRSPNDPSLT